MQCDRSLDALMYCAVLGVDGLCFQGAKGVEVDVAVDTSGYCVQ
jgi:hypothetical protein